MKHNYKKARQLFDRYFDLVDDPWTMLDEELRQVKRDFMYVVTHHIVEGIKPYTDYIEEEKQCVCVLDNGKSKVFNFDLMKKYDKLIYDIQNFIN